MVNITSEEDKKNLVTIIAISSGVVTMIIGGVIGSRKGRTYEQSFNYATIGMISGLIIGGIGGKIIAEKIIKIEEK